jgi:molybdate transport system regulatory protein
MGQKVSRKVSDVRLTVRIDFGAERALGPGKIRLLEAIGATGSISQAGRALAMSYRRAWLLVDDMNRCFRAPVVTTQGGGRRGGGATLTPFGRELIEKYRAIEAQATAAAGAQLRALETALRRRAPGAPKKPLKTSIRAATVGGSNQRCGASKP